MTVIEEGPVQGRIRITRTFGEGSTWTQDIVLNTGSKRLDFETKVDWQEVHRLLKVAFPVDVNSREVNYEIQNGYITRPSHEHPPGIKPVSKSAVTSGATSPNQGMVPPFSMIASTATMPSVTYYV